MGALSVKLHLRDERTVCPSVRPSLRWSLTLSARRGYNQGLLCGAW